MAIALKLSCGYHVNTLVPNSYPVASTYLRQGTDSTQRTEREAGNAKAHRCLLSTPACYCRLPGPPRAAAWEPPPAAPSYSVQQDDPQVPDEYIIHLAGSGGAAKQQIERILAATGGKVLRWWPAGYVGLSLRVPKTALSRIQAVPRVIGVYPNLIHTVATAEPLYGLTNIWGLDRIDQHDWDGGATPPADWTFHYYQTGVGVDVYVIDSGIADLPEFAGRLGAGYTSVGGTPTTPCFSHGTEVASVIGGTNYGVAKGVTLHPIRVVYQCGFPGEWNGADYIDGVNWVIAHHGTRSVANVSLGSGGDQAVDGATDDLIIQMPVVVAAGNDGEDACGHSPARVTAALTIAATDINDELAAWGSQASNYGGCVDLMAPGTAGGYDLNGNPVGSSGTSVAAPYVAGVVALMRSEHPAASTEQIRRVLQRSATSISWVTLQGSPPLLLYSLHTAPFLSGQSVIEETGYYTWTMEPWGGNGSYSFLWEYSSDGGQTYTPVGTSSTYTRYVAVNDPSFRLRASETSNGDSGSDIIDVSVNTCGSDLGC